MMLTHAKPWPNEIVMIVCARPGEQNSANMHTEEPVRCRDCHCPLVVDSVTIEKALAMPERQQRHLGFYCIPCSVKYEPPNKVTIMKGLGG